MTGVKDAPTSHQLWTLGKFEIAPGCWHAAHPLEAGTIPSVALPTIGLATLDVLVRRGWIMRRLAHASPYGDRMEYQLTAYGREALGPVAGVAPPRARCVANIIRAEQATGRRCSKRATPLVLVRREGRVRRFGVCWHHFRAWRARGFLLDPSAAREVESTREEKTA